MANVMLTLMHKIGLTDVSSSEIRRVHSRWRRQV